MHRCYSECPVANGTGARGVLSFWGKVTPVPKIHKTDMETVLVQEIGVPILNVYIQ